MSTKTEAQLKRKIRALRKSLGECRALAYAWAAFYGYRDAPPGSDIHPVHRAILDRAKAVLEES